MAKTPPPPPSKTSSLLPLLITALLLLIGAAVAYAVYAVAASVAEQTGRKMERRNVVVTRGGMKVGIKEVGSEREADRTQSMLVKAWNYSSWPVQKGGFWGGSKDGQGRGQGGGGGGGVGVGR
ncbi:MAG: hypothetical protein LQ344_002062 [Seirophora lacunosa]|nr:MAG: hypothetical protein LQ344_002062 [Seirophora lacunosa]